MLGNCGLLLLRFASGLPPSSSPIVLVSIAIFFVVSVGVGFVVITTEHDRVHTTRTVACTTSNRGEITCHRVVVTAAERRLVVGQVSVGTVHLFARELLAVVVQPARRCAQVDGVGTL